MNRRPVKSAVLGGKRVEVCQDDLEGYADDTEIWVSARLRGRKALEAWIHEAAHRTFPALPHGCIEGGAEEISRLLWRLGYRRRKRGA